MVAIATAMRMKAKETLNALCVPVPFLLAGFRAHHAACAGVACFHPDVRATRTPGARCFLSAFHMPPSRMQPLAPGLQTGVACSLIPAPPPVLRAGCCRRVRSPGTSSSLRCSARLPCLALLLRARRSTMLVLATGRCVDHRREQRQRSCVPEAAGRVPERGGQDRDQRSVQVEGGHVREGKVHFAGGSQRQMRLEVRFLEPRPEYIIDNINNGLYR